MKTIRSFFFVLLAAVAVGVQAESVTTRTLVITLTDATVATYDLATQPVITFNETDLILNSTEVSTSYDRTRISEFHFEEHTTDGIHSLRPNTSMAFSYVDGQTVQVSGTAASQVELYSLDGQRLMNAKPKDGVATLSLSSLPSGTYVVRTGTQSIKITKN